jgi:hypothetical protein
MDKLERLKSINSFDERVKNDLLCNILEDVTKYQYTNPTHNIIKYNGNLTYSQIINIETDKDYGIIFLENIIIDHTSCMILIKFNQIKSVLYEEDGFTHWHGTRHVVFSVILYENANEVLNSLTIHEFEHFIDRDAVENSYTKGVYLFNPDYFDTFRGSIKIYYKVL